MVILLFIILIRYVKVLRFLMVKAILKSLIIPVQIKFKVMLGFLIQLLQFFIIQLLKGSFIKHTLKANFLKVIKVEVPIVEVPFVEVHIPFSQQHFIIIMPLKLVTQLSLAILLLFLFPLFMFILFPFYFPYTMKIK